MAAAPDPTADLEELARRAKALGLYGLLANWSEYGAASWVEPLLAIEESERKRRSLERRIKAAKLGRFKLLADFDWSWPDKLDRERVEELFSFEFMREHSNVVFMGPNGVGKTMLARNLAHQAVLRGYTVRVTTASELLNDLAEQETTTSLNRRLKRVCTPSLLLIDEVGYLSYDSRHADLLFEVVNRRHLARSTVVTTNRAFSEWGEVFPNASCVVALVDRLLHRAEVLEIAGESYRLKEAKEREARRASERAAKRRRRKKPKAG